jgi:hypothetical protein
MRNTVQTRSITRTTARYRIILKNTGITTGYILPQSS